MSFSTIGAAIGLAWWWISHHAPLMRLKPIRCCERHAAHNFNAKDSAVRRPWQSRDVFGAQAALAEDCGKISP